MPRARHARLTDTFIESLLPQEGGRERIVRDGAIPGFLIRVGLRKRTFELRIEKPPKITVPVGHWPGLCAVEARRKAEDLWDKHRKGEALDDRPPRDDETIATTWPRFKQRLEDDGRSERTIEGYGDVFKRLSERVKQRPLRELASDPTIMEREVDRIREVLRQKKRGGQAMATTRLLARAPYLASRSGSRSSAKTIPTDSLCVVNAPQLRNHPASVQPKLFWRIAELCYIN